MAGILGEEVYETVWRMPFNKTFDIAVRLTHDEYQRVSVGLVPNDKRYKAILFQSSPEILPKLIKALQRAYQDASQASAIQSMIQSTMKQ